MATNAELRARLLRCEERNKELADMNAVLKIRIAELEDTPDPDPPPPPPYLTSIVPGTGAVLAEDLATQASPCANLWGNIQTPANDTCTAAAVNDPFITRRTTDGDTHLAIGKTTPSTHYRRFISLGGVQSIFDAGVNNGATRSHVSKWSSPGNQFFFAPGTYAHYQSFRLQSPSLFPHEQSVGGGNLKYSQLLQFKSLGGGLPNLVAFSVTIGSDAIKFIPWDGSGYPQKILPVPMGVWIRMAIVIKWTQPSWYEVWADLDNSGGMDKVVARQTGLNLLDGRASVAQGLGPYHKMSLFDGTVAGQPEQDIHVDYANAQRCAFTGP